MPRFRIQRADNRDASLAAEGETKLLNTGGPCCLQIVSSTGVGCTHLSGVHSRAAAPRARGPACWSTTGGRLQCSVALRAAFHAARDVHEFEKPSCLLGFIQAMGSPDSYPVLGEPHKRLVHACFHDLSAAASATPLVRVMPRCLLLRGDAAPASMLSHGLLISDGPNAQRGGPRCAACGTAMPLCLGSGCRSVASVSIPRRTYRGRDLRLVAELDQLASTRGMVTASYILHETCRLLPRCHGMKQHNRGRATKYISRRHGA